MILEPVHQNHWKHAMILEPVYQTPYKTQWFWSPCIKTIEKKQWFWSLCMNSHCLCINSVVNYMDFDTQATKSMCFTLFLIHRLPTHCFLCGFWYTGSKTIAFYKVFDPQVSNSLFFTMFLIHMLRNQCVLQWQMNRSLALVLLLKFGLFLFKFEDLEMEPCQRWHGGRCYGSLAFKIP